MRLLLFAIFLLALPISSLHSNSEPTELKPNCGGPFQLCGYREKGSGIQRIPMRFEIAQPFQEGMAAVRINGLHGFIDTHGKIVIKPRFQGAGSFRGGFAEVRVNGASGIIDRAGRMVVPAQFKRIIPFHGRTFIAEVLPKNGANFSNDEELLSGFSDSASYIPVNFAGLYDMKKGWLTKQNFKFEIFDVPERGLIWAATRNKNNEDVWGLLKSDGAWQVSPRYNHVQMLVDNRAVVRSMPDDTLPPKLRGESIRWGAVDQNGELVVPMKFKNLSYWRGGYGTAMDNNPYNADGTSRDVKHGIVRDDGTLLAGRYFDEIDIREDGLLPRGRIGNLWHSIGQDGKLMKDQLEGKSLLECAGGLSVVRRGVMVEFRRPQDGKPVGRFDSRYFNQRDCARPLAAKRNVRWFFVMEDGKVLGGPKGFDDIHFFNGRHAAVKVDGKWGIIDRSGEFSVRPEFAKLRPDRDGLFLVGEGEGAYAIDASGTRVPTPTADKVDPSKALICPGGLQFFEQEGLWGFRDSEGTTLIAPDFRALSCFSQGVSWAAAPGDNAWCAIGPDGSRQTGIACREGYYPYFVTHHYPEKFSDDPFENSVLWVRAWLDYGAGKRERLPEWIPDSMGQVSSSGREGGPVGPERNPVLDKVVLFATLLTLPLALFGFVRWRTASRA